MSLEVKLVPKQMKAVIFEQYGDADVLKYTDFRVPTLERGEALVKVHAVSLNGYDLMARAGCPDRSAYATPSRRH